MMVGWSRFCAGRQCRHAACPGMPVTEGNDLAGGVDACDGGPPDCQPALRPSQGLHACGQHVATRLVLVLNPDGAVEQRARVHCAGQVQARHPELRGGRHRQFDPPGGRGIQECDRRADAACALQGHGAGVDGPYRALIRADLELRQGHQGWRDQGRADGSQIQTNTCLIAILWDRRRGGALTGKGRPWISN